MPYVIVDPPPIQPPFGPSPPALAGKELPSFRYAFAGEPARKSSTAAGPRRRPPQQFPVSETLAGVLMQLEPGALRELHWHANAAEWAYVLDGRCRVTTIDPDNRSETVDFGPATSGTFRAATAIRSRASATARACSCWSSTTAISPSSAPSRSATGWRTRPPRCWPAISACPPLTFAAFPKERGLHRQGTGAAAAARGSRARQSLEPPLTHRYRFARPEAATSSRRHAERRVGGTSFRSRPP